MTATETPEQVFQRFQQSGDPADLAKVFDATAPQLLLLAAHVSPDGGAAEDLLQETFLKALEKSEQWDASRPLLPWLAGILRHRAQDLARKLRLRRPKAELADVVVAAEGVGPLGEAESNELLRRVQEALELLESPFREALVLRLVHGLQPTEIAHALGRPPVTVRGQLKRGLEVLRGVLPASLASGLAMLLLPGNGIAAVRATVLAASGKEQATAIALGGSSRSAVWLASIACLLGVLVGGYYVFFDTAPIAPPVSNVEAAHSGDTTAPEVVANPNVAADQRRDVTVVSKNEDKPNKSILRGRCVRETDGLPLVGGTATVSFGRGRFMTTDEEFRNWPDPIEVTIGAGGLFAVELEPQPLQRVFLEVATPGHSTATEEWISLRSGIDIDLGDIKLRPGCMVTARVIDEQGAPVRGAWISLERVSGGGSGSSFSPWSSIDRRSGKDGQFEELMPVGSYEVAARHDEALYRVLRPKQIEVPDTMAMPVEIVVRRTGKDNSIAGRVTDDAGQAVAGLIICLDPEYVDLGKTVTEADGSFYLPIAYPGKQRTLGLPGTDLRYRLLDPEREYTVGDQEVQLRVQRQPAADVDVQVVDARTGRPVEQYGIAHELDYWTKDKALVIPPDRFYRPVKPANYPGGRTTLKVYPGMHRLMVWPQDQDLATAYMIPFEVAESGGEPIRIELQGYARATLQLKDEAGKPLAGVEARLTHSLAAGPRFASMWSAEEFARGVGGGRATGVALQTLTTDANGRAVFRAPIGDDRLGLQLSGKWVRWERRPVDVVPAKGADWKITLPVLAGVRGVIGPEVFVQRTGPSPEELLVDSMVRKENSELSYACATLWLVGKDKSRPGRCPVMPDGSFTIDAVPPGDYEIVVEEGRVGEVVVSSVQLTPGEVTEVVLDASQFVPTNIDLAVLLNGAPWSRGEFGFVAVENGRTERVRLDSRGHGARLLRPRTYLPYLRWSDEGQSHKLFATERINLLSGSDVSQTFSFEQRKLRLTIMNHDGSPASSRLLFAKFVDYPEIRREAREVFKTDDDGVFVWDPAPPGRIELHLTKERDHAVAMVAVAPQEMTELRVQLPQ